MGRQPAAQQPGDPLGIRQTVREMLIDALRPYTAHAHAVRDLALDGSLTDAERGQQLREMYEPVGDAPSV
jgi:hypothetical protein